MNKYYSINKFSKILGVSAQTLRNWDKNNKLRPIIFLVMDTEIIHKKYEKKKKGESYCKTSNIIKREKELLKTTKQLTNIRINHTYIKQHPKS